MGKSELARHVGLRVALHVDAFDGLAFVFGQRCQLSEHLRNQTQIFLILGKAPSGRSGSRPRRGYRGYRGYRGGGGQATLYR
ncbi:MAG: hypothetical protein V3V08_06525 [Nannocystaceae bacterium]